MEYQSLGDLGKYILNYGVLKENIARDVTEQILQGVFVLHEHRMMHRDIKPEVCPSCPSLLFSYRAIYNY